MASERCLIDQSESHGSFGKALVSDLYAFDVSHSNGLSDMTINDDSVNQGMENYLKSNTTQVR